MSAQGKRPYWPWVCVEAMQPDNLPRVLASMGFSRYLGSVARGAIRWWPPEYSRAPDARGYYPRHPDAVEHDIDRFNASRRDEVAMLNRALRDSPVHLLALEGRVVCVDEFAGEGEWRTADGANRGRDLIDLGMWRWSCKFGQAAGRIARLIGMRTIPEVEA